MNEREFLAKYLPAGASDGHAVLYDFDGVFRGLNPSADTLADCVRDLLPMIQRVKFVQELYEEGFDACELALSLLARGAERNTALPDGELARPLIAEVNRLESMPRAHSDALKRLLGIREILSTAA
jgi:hypothetical protein